MNERQPFPRTASLFHPADRTLPPPPFATKKGRESDSPVALCPAGGGGGEEDEPNARTPPHPQRGAVVSKFRAGLKLRIRLFYRSGISYRDQEVSRQRRKSQLQDSKVADRHLGSVMPQ